MAHADFVDIEPAVILGDKHSIQGSSEFLEAQEFGLDSSRVGLPPWG